MKKVTIEKKKYLKKEKKNEKNVLELHEKFSSVKQRFRNGKMFEITDIFKTSRPTFILERCSQ